MRAVYPPMRILLSTSDGTKLPHFASLIPDDMRAKCNVGDLVFSTNTTRDAAGVEQPSLWADAGKRAVAMNAPFVADMELPPFSTQVATYVADKAKFAANLAFCGQML